MSKRNQEIRDLCDSEYPTWLWSRKKYVRAMPVNILAQFQPSKSYVEKDYDNSPLCAAFHLSIMHAIDRDIKKATCFLYVFFPKARPRPIKSLAYEFDVNKDTINEWAHETAVSIFSLAKNNVALNEMLANNDFKFGQ